MRSTSISCPKCKERLSLPEQFRGQMVRCAGCGHMVKTPPGARKPCDFKPRTR